MTEEFVRIARALRAIEDYVTELGMGETEISRFIERAQGRCEACAQPTRDALLMVMSGLAVEVMRP